MFLEVTINRFQSRSKHIASIVYIICATGIVLVKWNIGRKKGDWFFVHFTSVISLTPVYTVYL